MQIKTNAAELSIIYTAAQDAVAASGRCPKCWATGFAYRCFGRQTEVYTRGEPPEFWAYDVDRARAIVGDRIDGQVGADVLLQVLGETEPGHEFCLLKRANAGTLPPIDRPTGILLPAPELGGVFCIDGTHRGRLCIAAGVPMPVAVLTPQEADAVTLCRPGLNAAQVELDRLTGLFAGMDADAFFEETAAVLGKARLAEMLGDRS
jgi:hypothetical protein